MEKTNKLYRINLKGLTEPLNPSYIIAYDCEEAYRKVRAWLDDNDYGFSKYRELSSVELIAEDNEYTDVSARLFC